VELRDNQTNSNLQSQFKRMKILLIFLLLLISEETLIAQEIQPGIHEVQLNEYNALGNANAEHYESMPVEKIGFPKVSCALDKIVYGWHPYWVGSAYLNYQWDLLSHMSFFSYEVNAADGQPNSTHGWSTSAAIDSALASGNTKVTLCVTLFSGHSTFFGSPTAEQTLITNLINLVQSRGAHGVNIDFEGLPASQTTNFANFMVDLSNQMHSAISGSEVSTVLYAVDWNNVFDFSIMEPAVDHYIIMGYAYYYSGSSTAGPTDPLYHFGTSYNYTLSRSITYYLDKGCPKDKLVLGLPSYGYEWPTVTQTVPSATTGSGSSRTYAYVRNNTSGNYTAGNHIWEPDSYTDVYAFDNGGNRQCMISMDSAWRKRLEHVRNTGIAGIGIWALGYDNGYTELWSAMDDYLTVCYSDPCSGEIHDFGGPAKDYYDDEDYTWTIAPPSATSIDVQFTEFDVEANWDYLYVYDGADVGAPQIAGSPFTGLVGPGTFTTSTGAVTFRFTSDISTTTPGFLATYSCSMLAPPTANFSISSADVCLGDSIPLVNTSSNGDTYLWSTSSGGLSSATDENPYLFPSSSGLYTITLDVTNATGTDQTSQDVLINVYQPVSAIASVSATELFLPSAIAYFTSSCLNATDYFWDFGDGSSTTDVNPWHEYMSNGSYLVTMVASNSGCENDTVLFTINVNVAGLSGVDQEDLLVYPNPFTDVVQIQTFSEVGKIELIDAKGRMMSVEFDKNDTGIAIETGHLSAGVYTLEIEISESVIRKKLVKQ
jgi:spore germination protein YaaH/PKD repeat protein